MRSAVPTIDVLGVSIARLDPAEALDEVKRLLGAEEPSLVAYANAHTLRTARRHEGLRDALGSADLVLNDGSGVALAAAVCGQHFPANLNGTDFTPEILQAAAAGNHSVFLLGGMQGVAEQAATVLAQRYRGLRVVGTAEGYHSPERGALLAERIRETGAEVLLVGMGNPRQELWLSRHLPATGARLGVAVGAYLDFEVGVVPRAPYTLRRLGLEWCFRLSREPRRLFSRYVIGIPSFLGLVALDRMRRLRRGSPARVG